MKVKGLENVLKNFNKKLKEIENVTEDSIRDVALDLLGKAKERAPIDTGDLRGSGFAEFTESSTEYAAKVGFTETYALAQHEDLTFKHPQGGEAKYLENPLKENESKYLQHIRNKARKAVKIVWEY